MSLNSERTLNFQSVIGRITGNLVKVVPGACLTAFLTVGILGSSAVLADNNRHDERLGHYTLSDGSMLGRYGDVNDEWVQRASVSVSKEKMSPENKRANPKKESRLGAFSLEDGAMLGRYGDKDDGY